MKIVVIGGIGLIGSKSVATQDRKAFEPNAGRIQTPTDERDEHLLQDGGRHRLHSNLPAALRKTDNTFRKTDNTFRKTRSTIPSRRNICFCGSSATNRLTIVLAY